MVSVDDWCHYQQQKGVLPPIALAFYQFRTELLNTFDPSKPTIKTVSTPRTAEKAWKFWKANVPDAVKQAAMAGAIGDGPAAEAYAFADVWATLKDYIPRIMKDPQAYFIQFGLEAKLKSLNIMEIRKPEIGSNGIGKGF